MVKVDIGSLAGKIATVFTKATFTVHNWQRIANRLEITNAGDLHFLTANAGHNSWNFFHGVLERYFESSSNTKEQTEKLIELLKDPGLNCARIADEIRELPLVIEILGPVPRTVGSEPHKKCGNKVTHPAPQNEITLAEEEIPVYEINEADGIVGHALVVNFIDFDNTNWNRDGAIHDTPKLKALCKKLNLSWNYKSSLSESDLYSEVDNFIKKFDEDDPNKLCMVVILSHGEEGDSFLTKDMKQVSVYKQFLPKFDDNHKKLRGKPKIFVFGMCRGPNYAIWSVYNSKPKEQQYEFKDMFCFFSTAPTKYSMRSPTTGTWFIDSFTRVLGLNLDLELRDLWIRVDQDLEESLKKKYSKSKQQSTYSPFKFFKFFFKTNLN